ncbi:hypothetical protein [Alteribacillus iranensis]|uniref:Uncharacterized protein n=1 Tax=Alteribacillus iranensis TaxID=930128 RepID=A0A1I2DMZ9_9BACI|nr:hypothetical protein [Alteribacillus iranensis]SFE81779.1 hypothetical protein SAMN05192532_104175 [Alteribacillus iranensis]
MKRAELEEQIKLTENKILEEQEKLKELREHLKIVIEQEKERKHYISSKEIIDLIYKNTGKKINMSTVKRWADEGYLGEVIDEKDKFWALRSKQGKKRFLYPKINTHSFLYEKGYLHPEYEVLDRVVVKQPGQEKFTGIVVDSILEKDQFQYTIQTEETFEAIPNIKEEYLTKLE